MNMQQMKNKKYSLNGDSGSSTEPIQSSVKSSKMCTAFSQEWKSQNDTHIDLGISSANEDTSFYGSELKESRLELGKLSSSWPGQNKLFERYLKSLSQGNIMSKTFLSFKRVIKERGNETEEKSKPEDKKTIAKADLKIIDANEEARLHDNEISVPEVGFCKYSSSWPKLNMTFRCTFKKLSQPEMPSNKNMIEKSRVFPIGVESIIRMHTNPSQNDDVDIFSTSEDTRSEDVYDNDADGELGLGLYEPASWPGFSNSSEDKKWCFRSFSQPVVPTNRSNNANDNLPLELNKNYGYDKSQEVLDKKDNTNMLHQSSEITDLPDEDPDIYHDKVAEKRTVTSEEKDDCHFQQLDIRNISAVPSGLHIAGQEILPRNSEIVPSNKKCINDCEFNSTSTDHLSNVNDISLAEDVNTPSLKNMFLGNSIEKIFDNDGDTDSQIVPCLSLGMNNKLQNNNITEMEELNVSCSSHQTDFVHSIDVMEVLHDLWASSDEKECAHPESLEPEVKMNDCSESKDKYTSERDQGIDSSLNFSVEETVYRSQPSPVLDVNISTSESYKKVCCKGTKNVSEDSSVTDIDLIDSVRSLVGREVPDISPTEDHASHENSTSSPPKGEYIEDILYTEIDKAFSKYEEKMSNEVENYHKVGRNSLMKEVAVQTEITNIYICHQCKCTEYNIRNKKGIPLKHTKNISLDETEAKIALKRSMQALCLEIPTLKRIRLHEEVNVHIQVGKKEGLFEHEYEKRKVMQQRTPNITYNCGSETNTIGGNKEEEEKEEEEEGEEEEVVVCKLLSTTTKLNSFTNSQIKEKDQEVPKACGQFVQTNNYNCPSPEYSSLRSAFPWQNSLITNSAKIYAAEELMKEEEEHNQNSLSSHPAPRLRLGLSKRAKPRRLHISKN